MKRWFVFVFFWILTVICTSQEWQHFGPQGIQARCFAQDSETGAKAIFTYRDQSAGYYLSTDSLWVYHDLSLPLLPQSACFMDASHLLISLANAEGNDQMILVTGDEEVQTVLESSQIEALYTDPRAPGMWHALTDAGLYHTRNGVNWWHDDAIQTDHCHAMTSWNETTLLSTDIALYRAAHTENMTTGNRLDMGLLEDDNLVEVSGMGMSARGDFFWMLNDTPEDHHIYAVNCWGQTLGSYELENITANNWEALSTCRDQENHCFVYVGDLGDHSYQTDLKHIYRLEEPDVASTGTGESIPVTNFETITFRYQDQVMLDAETLLTDPRSGDIYIITKRNLTNAVTNDDHDWVYLLPYPQGSGILTAELLGSLNIPASTSPNGAGYGAVDGCISPDGSQILVKTYDHVYLWQRELEATIWQALNSGYTTLPYLQEPQGESICFDMSERGFYTTSEEPFPSFPAHLYFYPRNINWQSVSSQDFMGMTFTDEDDFAGYTDEGLFTGEAEANTWQLQYPATDIAQLFSTGNHDLYLRWSLLSSSHQGIASWNMETHAITPVVTGIEGRLVNFITSVTDHDHHFLVVCTDQGMYRLMNGDANQSQTSPVEANNITIQGLYPNPMNRQLSIRVSLKRQTNLQLAMYNLRGQRVGQWSCCISAGRQDICCPEQMLTNLPDGIYLLTARDGNHSVTQKVVKLRP